MKVVALSLAVLFRLAVLATIASVALMSAGCSDSSNGGWTYAGLDGEFLAVEDAAFPLWIAAGGVGDIADADPEEAMFGGHEAWLLRDVGVGHTDICLWLWSSGHHWDTCSRRGTLRAAFERYRRNWPVLEDVNGAASGCYEQSLLNGEKPVGALLDRGDRLSVVRGFVRRHRGRPGFPQALKLLRSSCELSR